MTGVAVTERPGRIALRWWGAWIDADTGAARALAARLRRAGGAVAVLSERPVVELFHELSAEHPGLGRGLRADPGRLVLLVRVLAHVDAHQNTRLARLLGQGETPALSPARFERLMRIGDDWDALAGALIRALPMLGATVSCNVAALADDLLNWGDDARTRWCFDYFGSAAPDALRPGHEGDKE